MEIWKDIPGYIGYYQVSSLGRVKSVKRDIIRDNRRNVYIPEKILKPMTSLKGYKSVRLYSKDDYKTIRVHKLVAICFMGYKKTKEFVIDHIDNDPSNNKLSNLQIVTHRVNTSKDKKNKTSKYTGVSWVKQSKKWRSTVMIKNKGINLGHYNDELFAHELYLAACKNHHLFNGDAKAFRKLILGIVC